MITMIITNITNIIIRCSLAVVLRLLASPGTALAVGRGTRCQGGHFHHHHLHHHHIIIIPASSSTGRLAIKVDIYIISILISQHYHLNVKKNNPLRETRWQGGHFDHHHPHLPPQIPPSSKCLLKSTTQDQLVHPGAFPPHNGQGPRQSLSEVSRHNHHYYHSYQHHSHHHTTENLTLSVSVKNESPFLILIHHHHQPHCRCYVPSW